jgi:hypothetical protein
MGSSENKKVRDFSFDKKMEGVSDKEVRSKCVRSARVVFATLSKSYLVAHLDPGSKFDWLMIDEAGQVSAPLPTRARRAWGIQPVHKSLEGVCLSEGEGVKALRESRKSRPTPRRKQAQGTIGA